MDTRISGAAEALAMLWKDWQSESDPNLKPYLWMSVERCIERICELTEAKP